MYIASQQEGSNLTYQLRQSYFDQNEGCYQYKVVYELGAHPADHFELHDNTIPLFSTDLIKTVQGENIKNVETLLEELFWDFFPPQTTEMLSTLKRANSKMPRPLSDKEKEEINATVHIFDRRRLYYLYYQAIDQSRLFRMHEKLCRPLLGRCRDEREYQFRKMERALSPREYHGYVYAIFNIQYHFDEIFAPFLPEALSYDEIGEHFVDTICELNGDKHFWRGEMMGSFLHPHLHRYLVMYFDFTPEPISIQNDFVRNFMNSRRTFKWPEQKIKATKERVSEIFSMDYDDLKKMGKKELSRLFRKKAMELHPDKGGDQDDFVELTNIYESLIKNRK